MLTAVRDNPVGACQAARAARDLDMPILGILADTFIEAFGEESDRDRAMRVVILEAMRQGLTLSAVRPQMKSGPAVALFSIKTQSTFLVTRQGVSITAELPAAPGWEAVHGQPDLQEVFRSLFSGVQIS